MKKFAIFTTLIFLVFLLSCKKKSEESSGIESDSTTESEFSVKSTSTSESGYVFLKRYPKLVKDIETFQITPDWLAEMQKISAESWDGLPNYIYPYIDRKTKEGRDFFYIRKQIMNYYSSEEAPEKGDLVEGWVDSSYIYMQGSDLLEDSKKKEKDSAKLSILEYLISLKKDIRYAGDLEIRDRFENISPGTSYYVINYHTKDKDFNDMYAYDSPKVLRKKDNEYQFIDLPSSNDGMKPVDLNGDGILEWMLFSMGEGDFFVSVAFLHNGEYKERISVWDRTGSYGQCVLSYDPNNSGEQVEKLNESMGDVDHDQFKCKLEVETGKIKASVGTKTKYFSFDGKILKEII